VPSVTFMRSCSVPAVASDFSLTDLNRSVHCKTRHSFLDKVKIIVDATGLNDFFSNYKHISFYVLSKGIRMSKRFGRLTSIRRKNQQLGIQRIHRCIVHNIDNASLFMNDI
ncbi:hypothetical protein L9F63_010780, partial [Diploptera punctata]